MKLAPLAAGAALALAASTLSASARSGTFDPDGVFYPSPLAQIYEDFSTLPKRYLPPDTELECVPLQHEHLSKNDATAAGGALTGTGFVRLPKDAECPERFRLDLPKSQASYRASLWSRHGSLGARVVVSYNGGNVDDEGSTQARMFPTGRTTSDGWVEYASNDFPVDGAQDPIVYLRVSGFASREGVDIDALEIIRSGTFEPQQSCSGVRDPVCGAEGLCVYEQCQLPRLGVPPLPEGDLKNQIVDTLKARINLFYGGRDSRLQYLPTALDTLESMRQATTAWQFWNTYGLAVRQLNDWHTSARASISTAFPTRRLNACFVEGVGDLSQAQAPSDPEYPDILVSHAGLTAAGLKPGDRLIEVDGEHPIAWARGLIDVDWGYSVATDATVHADFAQALGGPWWMGTGLIVQYASSFKVVRCDASGTCEEPETISVKRLVGGGDDPDLVCDNRPLYHLGPDSPDPNTHYVFGDFFRGRVDGTTTEEAIFGMVWDTLYGGGDPEGWVNTNISEALDDWKANARGVILDHRTGNGGTFDAPSNFTRLVRPADIAAVFLSPIQIGGFDGPATPEEGVDLFNQFSTLAPFTVGSTDFHEPTLPVALLIQRSGSASDFLPYAMKGSPKVRVFGSKSQGAFSTFINFSYYGGFNLQLASGDTIGPDGAHLIANGVVPDEVVLQKQSDLANGVDTVHEAALAWVRQELKP